MKIILWRIWKQQRTLVFLQSSGILDICEGTRNVYKNDVVNKKKIMTTIPRKDYYLNKKYMKGELNL
jgi:hypothetical protein